MNMQIKRAVPSAKLSAVEYVSEKYGENPKALSTDPIFHVVGYMFGSGKSFIGTSVNFDGYTVKVYNDGIICDNRQYNEICAAFEEKYFNNTDLGLTYAVESLSIDFNEAELSKGDEGEYTSKYFNGDIEKFLSEASDAEIAASVTYAGYSDKRGEYRKLLNDKLYEIYDTVDDKASVFIYIRDIGLDLPEMPYKAVDKARFQAELRYEDYMELIAYGYTSNPSNFDKYPHVYMTEWYDVDGHTAISDDLNPIQSEKDFVFEQVDLSDNTTVYRGRYKYDDRADNNILTIRDNGYRVQFDDSRRLDSIFLRLDRDYYNITDKTIPLIVADWNGKRFYLTVGYGDSENTVVDTNYEDWYYLDKEYLYLYITSLHSDFYSNEWRLTFSDS